LLEDLALNRPKTLKLFAFVMTGGTFRRILGLDCPDPKGLYEPLERTSVREDVRNILMENGVIRLPMHQEGGVLYMSYLVVRRRLSILWPFYTPITPHWLNPDNSALMRLCDCWHVNRLFNRRSIDEWIDSEQCLADASRNRQPWPPKIEVEFPAIDDLALTFKPFTERKTTSPEWIPTIASKTGRRVDHTRRLALISHDQMKDRMVEFVVDYERELDEHFDQIITTGTTGKLIQDASRVLRNKVKPYYSGPKGGDIEIALEVARKLVDSVVFFIDPLRPHPHIDDIRVVIGACMMAPVRMLTNERQAREWMESKRGMRRDTQSKTMDRPPAETTSRLT
jgi:methylglyoxal synthase